MDRLWEEASPAEDAPFALSSTAGHERRQCPHLQLNHIALCDACLELLGCNMDLSAYNIGERLDKM